MSAEPTSTALRPSLRLRVDQPGEEGLDLRPFVLPIVFVLAAGGFVLIGGGNLDVGPTEAKLGLSAVEPIGPFGQVLGAWEPSVWVGQVLPSRIWAAVGGMTNDAIVRWPAAIAGVLIGLLLCRAMRRTLGTSAACLSALAWFGGLALMDRSADAGLDLVAGLGTVAALNRLLAKGSGWVAGLWASWAFLAGGWPPLAIFALASILLGRAGATLTVKTILPVVATVVGWSAWSLASTKAQVWAAALSLPLTQGPSWTMALEVLALGLPWSPFALLGFSKSVRDGWVPAARPFAIGWGQAAIACLIAGTVVPGLDLVARMPALAGLAIVAAASLDSVLAADLSPHARRWLHVASLTVALGWAAVVVVWGGHLAVAVGYYRSIAIVLIALAVIIAPIAASASWLGDRRGTLAAIVLVAISLKLAHWGHHVPEWNYRNSQGPWGRAVGQWVPPKRKVHVLTAWPADLLFAIGHPVRLLAHPRLLPDHPAPGAEPKFLLLLESEFANWQPSWPKILLMSRFEDEYGGARVLARTEGVLTWKKSFVDSGD